ncbi:glycosyltransferase family A protein [Breoghania sp.]|uniref:glycosyltransferase family 2 protein n=1 Tax=Breoghania sp. TaxID=2065378 RepID=UPI002AA5E659|nr:glycosyltransferase family A protein [Breoghania sp.]
MLPYTALIPTFNGADFIAGAIGSIRAQSVPPDEIIVVDDGSTDATVETVRALGDDIVILRQENRGVGSATSAGFARASSPVVATLDCDDLWAVNKMEAQFARLAADPALAGAFSHYRFFRDGTPWQEQTLGAPVAGWLRSTMVMKREVFDAVGPMIDPPGGCGDLIDWLARVREGGHHLAMLEEPLALRRIRPGSLSHQQTPERDGGYLHAARLAILRRRQQQGE